MCLFLFQFFSFIESHKRMILWHIIENSISQIVRSGNNCDQNGDRLSKYDKSWHICSVRLKRFFCKMWKIWDSVYLWSFKTYVQHFLTVNKVMQGVGEFQQRYQDDLLKVFLDGIHNIIKLIQNIFFKVNIRVMAKWSNIFYWCFIFVLSLSWLFFCPITLRFSPLA